MDKKYEEILSKIKEIFSKLRNCVNERENILLENLNKIKSNEKKLVLLNKALIDINKINESLNKNDVGLDETLLSKNDKNINNVYDEINKYKKEIELQEDNFTYEENILNEIIDKINNFGKFDNNSKYLKFNWKSGPNYSLSNNNNIATKINGGNGYNCNILGNKILPKNKVSKWRIKLNTKKSNMTWDILIGVGPSDLDQNNENLYSRTWTLICEFPAMSIQSGSPTYAFKNKSKVKEGDIVEVIVDLIKGELSFTVNDIFYGIGCKIPLDINLSPFVLIYVEGESIELIDN